LLSQAVFFYLDDLNLGREKVAVGSVLWMRHVSEQKYVSLREKVAVDFLRYQQAVDIQSAIVNVDDCQGARTMHETQQTSTSNTYFDIVSVLYHALREEQTCATYVQDAQKSGNQDLVQFFAEVKQNASRQADRAKELLGRVKS
jgi:hypothetical protein